MSAQQSDESTTTGAEPNGAVPTGPVPTGSVPTGPVPTVGSAGGSPAVRQAFTVIDAVAEAPTSSRLRDIVEATGLAKSTVHRLAGALVDLEVLRTDDDGYRLGPRLVRYGDAVVDDTSDLIGMFYASVGDVHDRLDETIQLGVYAETGITFVAFVDTTRPVRLATYLGRSIPAHASATGKAI
ncbi:MAG: helix-turn-helix domain-containing protein, partial [Williamsia herbipolensis]|nr:helix-turn-helix domain-containing protein [Williamsia herbipolensis]